MATVKPYIHDRTNSNFGQSDIARDSESVTVWVENVAGTTSRQIQDEARVKAIEQVGTVYNGIPLATVRVGHIADDRGWVTLLYSRSASDDPTLDASDNVEKHYGYMWDYGQVGTFIGTHIGWGGVVATYSHNFYRSGFVAVTKYRMRTVLDESPGLVIQTSSNYTNGNAYVLGGQTHEAGLLRFEQANERVIEVRDGTSGTVTRTRHEVIYNFTRKENGWVRRIIPVGVFPNEPPQVITFPNFPGTMEFNNTAFPVHN